VAKLLLILLAAGTIATELEPSEPPLLIDPAPYQAR
jgi:hypothetical protein